MGITDLKSDPVARFKASDEDVSGDPVYYGFVDRDGNWYIMENNSANGTYRFAEGSSDYTTNWTNRATLSYDYFYNMKLII